MRKVVLLFITLIVLSGCAAGSFSDGNMTAHYIRFGDQNLSGFSVKSKDVNATLEKQQSKGADLSKLLKALSSAGAI